MKSWTIWGAVVLVGAAAVGVIGLMTQSAGQDFDPSDPFARIASAADWVKTAETGARALDPNDRFRNLTSEAWAAAWEDRTEEQQKLSTDGFLRALSGSGGTGVKIRSPYPYASAQEHYEAWLKAAEGGTKHTRATLPDWSGDWQGNDVGVLGRNALVRDVWEAVAPDYRPAFQQLLTAELEGRAWWPADSCFPDGVGRFYSLGGTYHFMMDQTIVLIDKDRPNSETRYVYFDGRGFLPPEQSFPMWYGQSQGFWHGDELVVWTRDIKQWVITHALPEHSGELQMIERIKRIGEEIVLDLTLYDAKAFAFPWHDVVVFKKLADWKDAPPTFSECAFSNNVYHDANGELQSYAPGDPNFRDVTDQRPWATVFERAEEAKAVRR
jgi:hypothetical protein